MKARSTQQQTQLTRVTQRPKRNDRSNVYSCFAFFCLRCVAYVAVDGNGFSIWFEARQSLRVTGDWLTQWRKTTSNDGNKLFPISQHASPLRVFTYGRACENPSAALPRKMMADPNNFWCQRVRFKKIVTCFNSVLARPYYKIKLIDSSMDWSRPKYIKFKFLLAHFNVAESNRTVCFSGIYYMAQYNERVKL